MVMVLHVREVQQVEGGPTARSEEKKKGQKPTQQRGGGQRSEGLPDNMSCAGVFGNDCTKTVVMEHHEMKGLRSSPVHKQILKPVMKAGEILSAMRTKGGEATFKDQKSIKYSHGFIVKLGK